MDQSHRPTTYRQLRVASRRRHPVFNTFMAAAFAGLGFVAFTSTAHAPGAEADEGLVASVVPASLSYSGRDVVITGSVEPMFQSVGTFVGPNRAEKQDRARLTPDPLQFVSSFDEARLELASLRAGAFNEDAIPSPTPVPPVATVSSVVAVPPPIPVDAIAPRVAVASLGPDPQSAALTAIQSVAPGPAAPMPLVLSDELAYARAEAPVTTFTAPPVDAKGRLVSDRDLWCLSQAIYFEARGESYKGQIAVAQVVLNRLKHPIYPKTICGVVFQNQQMRNACQFSFACDGIPERVNDPRAWKQAQEIATGALAGKLYVDEVGKATHYHAAYVYPDWAPRMKRVTRIGMHVFYQFKRNWRFG